MKELKANQIALRREVTMTGVLGSSSRVTGDRRPELNVAALVQAPGTSTAAEEGSVIDDSESGRMEGEDAKAGAIEDIGSALEKAASPLF